MTERPVSVGVDGGAEQAAGGPRTGGRPPRASSSYGPWTGAWAGLAALAVANGLSRGLYARRLGDDRAHRASTATLIAAMVPYAWAVERRWPIPTAGAAAGIGATWVTLTVGFEFALGHYVAKQSWPTLVADYNLRRGRLWPLVLAATAGAPAAARMARRRRAASRQ